MREPADELQELAEASLLRQLRRTDRDADLVNFSSNDYLGLSRHPDLITASAEALHRYGTGATASRLVCGTHDYHEELEERIAEAKGTTRALTFSTGFATAMGTVTALLGKGDTVILDKLCHACLIDAARLSGATLRVFPHNHLDKLEHLLKSAHAKATPSTRILVITESVFSMDGDCSPLAEIVALKNRYGALLLLDEAHALGVLGPHGLGLADALALQPEVDLHMGTLGKAAGSAGGYLAANGPWIDLLINRARSFIYSTAPPAAQVAASIAALKLIQSPQGRALQQKLSENIALLQQELSLTERPLATAIVPLIIGANERTLEASRTLLAAGFLVPAIRYPTVPRHTARLRVTLSASHRVEEVQAFAKAVRLLFATDGGLP